MILPFSEEWRLERKQEKAWEVSRQEFEKLQQLLKTTPNTDPAVTEQQMAYLTAFDEYAKARNAFLECQRAKGKDVESMLEDLRRQAADLKKQTNRN